MRKLCFVFLFCCMFANSAMVKAATFNDIDGHWAEDVIDKWKNSGYVSGYPDGSFKPDNPITRAELSKILSIAFELKECKQLSYEDVEDNAWYYSYLEKSGSYIPIYPLPTLYESNMPYHENHIKHSNNFLPNENAIRMHVAEALVEINLENESISFEELSVQEINQRIREVYIDGEYQNLYFIPGTGIPPNVQRMNRYTWLAHKLNIMKGDTDGYFNPYGYITRAELVTAIDRIMK